MRSFGIAAAAAAAAVALAGCGAGSDCQKLTPQLENVPACANPVAPSTTVSYQLGICPTCTQTEPSCVAVYDNLASDRVIQLEPFVAMCEPDNTCPPKPPCNILGCTFQSPAAPGPYTLRVFDANLAQHDVPFTVADGGSATCI